MSWAVSGREVLPSLSSRSDIFACLHASGSIFMSLGQDRVAESPWVLTLSTPSRGLLLGNAGAASGSGS